MWTSILSLASNSTFHDLKCFNCECDNCGIEMLITYFAENYIFMDFNEIREIYWHSFQLIILAHVSYRWNLAYISDVNSGVKKLITEYH